MWTVYNPVIVWMGLVIALLVIEIATLGLTTIWFAGGALAALIASLAGAGVGVQWGVFLVLSLVLMIVTRPMAVRFLNVNHIKTNADSLIGKFAIVTGEINNLAQCGEVIISDVSWTARATEDEVTIAKGSKVKICAIEGVKLIVEEIKEDK